MLARARLHYDASGVDIHICYSFTNNYLLLENKPSLLLICIQFLLRMEEYIWWYFCYL